MKNICDCGHDQLVHSDSDPSFCEQCGGTCREGGFKTYQRQIDQLKGQLKDLQTELKQLRESLADDCFRPYK